MCTRLKKPPTDAHGSGFLCPVAGRVVRRTGVRRFSGLRLSALRPSLRRRGGVGCGSSAHALTIATGCFAPQAVIRNGRLSEIKRRDGFEAMVFGSLGSDAEVGWRRNCHTYAAIGALENRGSSAVPTLQGEALQIGDNFITDQITDSRQFEASDPARSCQ
jgi:hypothetical protein